MTKQILAYTDNLTGCKLRGYPYNKQIKGNKTVKNWLIEFEDLGYWYTWGKYNDLQSFKIAWLELTGNPAEITE